MPAVPSNAMLRGAIQAIAMRAKGAIVNRVHELLRAGEPEVSLVCLAFFFFAGGSAAVAGLGGGAGGTAGVQS